MSLTREQRFGVLTDHTTQRLGRRSVPTRSATPAARCSTAATGSALGLVSRLCIGAVHERGPDGRGDPPAGRRQGLPAHAAHVLAALDLDRLDLVLALHRAAGSTARSSSGPGEERHVPERDVAQADRPRTARSSSRCRRRPVQDRVVRRPRPGSRRSPAAPRRVETRRDVLEEPVRPAAERVLAPRSLKNASGSASANAFTIGCSTQPRARLVVLGDDGVAPTCRR